MKKYKFITILGSSYSEEILECSISFHDGCIRVYENHDRYCNSEKGLIRVFPINHTIVIALDDDGNKITS